MESMKHLLKVTKLKLIIMSLSVFLPIVILIVMESTNVKIAKESAWHDLLIFRYGIFVLLEGYIFMKLANYIKILINPDYASNILLTKNDERISFIKLKTNAMAIKIFIYCVAIAIIVSAFINAVVFYTLIAVLGGVLISYAILYIYYYKKY